MHGSRRMHQFSFTLSFDALLQTCVDYMHREMLGMIQLHFKCIWATMSTSRQLILSNRVKDHPKVLTYSTFPQGLYDKNGNCLIKSLYSREWLALSKYAFVCLEGKKTKASGLLILPQHHCTLIIQYA